MLDGRATASDARQARDWATNPVSWPGYHVISRNLRTSKPDRSRADSAERPRHLVAWFRRTAARRHLALGDARVAPLERLGVQRVARRWVGVEAEAGVGAVVGR